MRAISARVFKPSWLILFVFFSFPPDVTFMKQLSWKQNRTLSNRKLVATLYNSLFPVVWVVSKRRNFKVVRATIYSWTLPEYASHYSHAFITFGRTHLTSWRILNFFNSWILFPHWLSETTSMSITLITNGLCNFVTCLSLLTVQGGTFSAPTSRLLVSKTNEYKFVQFQHALILFIYLFYSKIKVFTIKLITFFSHVLLP